MRVVQIAPPWFPVPPIGYGGIERVVHDLTEGLVAAGCEVILCAPPGSETSARLIPTGSRPLGLNMAESQKVRYFAETSRAAYAQALDLGADLIHDHTDHLPAHKFPIPVIRTIHGPPTVDTVNRYRRMTRRGNWFVAISERQRTLFIEAADRIFGPGKQLACDHVVFNPVNVRDTPFYPADRKRGHVAFLGRCHWEKSPDGAIRVAQAADVPLMMALRITSEEQAYFDAVVRPLVRSTKNLAKLVGEVSGKERHDLMGEASAVLFPSPWEEPFGLVLAESAAHGTPVVALARGSVPEVIADGVTGILCADEEEMARAVPRAMALKPEDCRARAEQLFDRAIIAKQYLAVYEQMLADQAT